MISLQILAIILVTHFLADFALQTPEQAIQKSTSDKQLLWHVSTYTAVWLFVSFGILGGLIKPILFIFFTFVTHYNTDYVTSRIVKTYREKEDYHNMFVVIGADQVLHYTQLFLTYWILK